MNINNFMEFERPNLRLNFVSNIVILISSNGFTELHITLGQKNSIVAR